MTPASQSPQPSVPDPVPFTCTFCWRTFTPPSSQYQDNHPYQSFHPRVIGPSSTARLACSRCHAALISLAVCWGCGQLVSRGQACVSLGWCFWHWGCYGCLFCGDRRVVIGRTVSQVWDEQKVVEVQEVPVCEGCLGDVEGETDGANFEDKGGVRETGLPRSTIYVSMRDPVGEGAFRPKAGKPIPCWMQPSWEKIAQQSQQLLEGKGHRKEASREVQSPSPCGQPAQRLSEDGQNDERPTTPIANYETLVQTPLRQAVSSDAPSTSVDSDYLTPPEYPSPGPSRRLTFRTLDLRDSSRSIPLSLIHSNSNRDLHMRRSCSTASSRYHLVHPFAIPGTFPPLPVPERRQKSTKRQHKETSGLRRSVLVNHFMAKVQKIKSSRKHKGIPIESWQLGHDGVVECTGGMSRWKWRRLRARARLRKLFRH